MPKLRIRVTGRVENEGGKWDLVVTPVALTSDVGAVLGVVTGDSFTVGGLTSAQAAANSPGTTYNCPIQP